MSFIETYQGRKSLFASKLITKGVSASASDGLTTLINKIDDIGSGFNTGLLLSADKSIAQSSNTVTLSALLLKNGVFQVGEKVSFFNGNTLTYNRTTSEDIDIGENGWKISITAQRCRVYIGTDNTDGVAICKTSDGYAIGDDTVSAAASTNLQGSYVYFNGSDLTLYSDVDSFDISNFDDISNWDSSNIWYIIFDPDYSGTVTVEKGVGVATTNNNGVATATYTCTGAGEKNFKAISGTVSSDTYEVWDTIKFDNMTVADHNDIWSTTSADSTFERGEEYTTFSKTVSSNKYKVLSNVTGNGVCFEFEVYQVSGYRNQTFLFISDSSSQIYTCNMQKIGKLTGEWAKCQLIFDNGEITFKDVDTGTTDTASSDKTLDSCTFGLIGDAFRELRIKNFKCYYI